MINFNLSNEEKIKLIKQAKIQLYKNESLIKLFYKKDNSERLLVLKNERDNLYYYVIEKLIIFNDEQLKKVNEGYPDVVYGGWQQQDNGYGYSVFESLEHLLSEIKPNLILYNEESF